MRLESVAAVIAAGAARRRLVGSCRNRQRRSLDVDSGVPSESNHLPPLPATSVPQKSKNGA
jgi:hypothetical protein